MRVLPAGRFVVVEVGAATLLPVAGPEAVAVAEFSAEAEVFVLCSGSMNTTCKRL